MTPPTATIDVIPSDAEDETLEDEYNRYCHDLIKRDEDGEEGWRSELCRYLADMPPVGKDLDFVKYWEVC